MFCLNITSHRGATYILQFMDNSVDERPVPTGFDPDEFFERAAILEFDGKYSRYTAFNLAWDQLKHLRDQAKAEKKKLADAFLSKLLQEYSKTGGFV